MAPEPADRYRAAEAVRADLLHLTHGQAATVQAAELPDVVGLDEQVATSTLERDGFVANISLRPSNEAPGVVTSQSPGAGQRPPRGAIVFLTVSSGPADSTVPGGRAVPGGPVAPPATRAPASPTAPPTTAAQASP